MSKWNKPVQPLTEQFIQNEERRKQMIMEAARRRRQKEKKVLEQQQKQRKKQQQALTRHKQQKKDAYIKYLRSNMHDKYEDMKRRKKQQEPEIKPMTKWKKKSAEKEKENQHLQALDLEVNVDTKSVSPFNINTSNHTTEPQKPISTKENRKKIVDQFEQEWQMQIDAKQELLSSKLLDSLDLDIGTINRGMHKKQNTKKQQKPQDLNQLRDLIGYESIVVQPAVETKSKAQQKPESKPKSNKKKEVNQVQVFNQLKHKKQTKILHWAIEEQLEAEDLFSNCSSKKKIIQTPSQQVKSNKIIQPPTFKKQPDLYVISETQKKVENSKEKKNSSKDSQKQPVVQPKPPVRPSSKQKSAQINGTNKVTGAKSKNASYSNFNNKQETRVNLEPAKTANQFRDKNMTRIRTTSRQKSQHSKQKKKQNLKIINKPEAPKKAFGNLPPLPVPKAQNNSIATHDIQMQIESFIKQDLLNLNQQQYKLQEQLRQIHKNNRDNIKEVYSKYEIKANYKRSKEITGEQTQNAATKYVPNQENLQNSIQNLDNMLIRKEITGKNNYPIREQTEEESRSYINPFSHSEDLCNQVLQLAKNVSRFQKKNQTQNGYAFLNRTKKNTSAKRITGNSKDSKNEVEDQQLSESKQVSQIQQMPLSRPPFIFEASEMSSKYNAAQAEPKQKIHVNARLLKGLLLDDN